MHVRMYWVRLVAVFRVMGIWVSKRETGCPTQQRQKMWGLQIQPRRMDVTESGEQRDH